MSGQETAEMQHSEIKFIYKYVKNLKHVEMKL